MTVPGNVNELLLAADAAGGGGYTISRSLRFNSADSAYLSRTPASAGNRRTWTWAGWVKRSGGTYPTLFNAVSGTRDVLRFSDDAPYADVLYVFFANGGGGSIRTTAVFRDYSAWYHIVLSVDTTQATASNRVKIYVNGVQQTQFTVATYPTQNYDTFVNNTNVHYIGADNLISASYFSGYLADVHLVDGQALDPTSFGEFSATTGVWMPKAFTGSYGTNGFKLDFADNSAATAAALGKDTSGNGNNWTPTNLSVTAGAGNDSLIDVPVNGSQTDTGVGGEVRGNYATFNPLNNPATSATLGNGNLEVTANTAAFQAVTGTVFASSGKWYAEFTQQVTATDQVIGIAADTFVPLSSGNRYIGRTADSYGIYSDGRKINNNVFTSYGTSWAVGDVLNVALDLDNGKVWFGKNGTWYASGNPAAGTNAAFTGISGSYTFACSPYSTGKFEFNSGQRPFAYTAPSGFKALCTANLPAPTIVKPSTVMDVVLYTGTGSTLTPTSSLGFSPDLVWIKSRSAATDNTLYDAVRGAQARLESNTTDAEVTSDNGLTAFNSAGFTLGTLAQVNTSSATYAAWTWDAGSSTVSNTAGTITSSVRANASAGFSVATYTGTGANATVGHGLGVAPSLIIVKCRSAANDWAVYHAANTSDPKTDYLLLNSTAATADDNTYWNDTAPTSTVFSIGTNADVNTSTATYVAYCFAPVAGYSAFGSYTGNGSADGSFVYTGMRSRWIMIKRTDTTSNWTIIDTAREGYNVDNDPLYPNLADAEGTTDLADILSNGFKLRSTDASVNASSGTYVYAAFSEAAFQYSRAR
jgi:hypothetical protein